MTSIRLADGPAAGREFSVPLPPGRQPSTHWPVQDTNGHTIYGYVWNELPPTAADVFTYVFVCVETPVVVARSRKT